MTARRIGIQIAADESELIDAYGQIRIGDPLDKNTLMGPLVDKGAVDEMQRALQAIQEQGVRSAPNYGNTGESKDHKTKG